MTCQGAVSADDDVARHAVLGADMQHGHDMLRAVL